MSDDRTTRRQGEQGKLVICPTPIGNLGDMTPRALDALRDADTVCAEDTRVTRKLLASFGIGVRLERLDENSLSQRAGSVVDRVLAGERIAYCSDAGMPGVSDPGQRLVALARSAGVHVEVLPGATAFTTAYAASGFTCPRFYFGGFLPRKDAARSSLLEGLASLDAVLLFYESPHRLVASLRVAADVLPLRRVAVCRELTKLHEEVRIGSAAELARLFAEREAREGIKGEIAIAIDAPGSQEAALAQSDVASRAEALAADLAAEGLRAKEVAARLVQECGLSRNEAYDIGLRAVRTAR